ncbi:MAG: FtsW/RodA/SpoVE family cell cycle protein [Flavobacteriales bacterium]|nr:FtsW/RodA/SpoVE family cell cycle protein [Flavobacteriales bacterium]
MKALFERHLHGDRIIWVVVLFLGLLSLLSVYSGGAWLIWRSPGGGFRLLFKHALMLASGGAIMYMASRLRYTAYSKLSQLLIVITGGLLLLTLLVGSNVNGASRWLAVPGLGITFQTSDLAKVVLLVYLARVLSKQQEEPWTFREVLLRLGIPIGAICGLILPANFSTAALLGITCLVLLFIARVPFKHIGGLILLAIAAFALLLVVAKTYPDLLPRIQTWEGRLERWLSNDPQTTAEDRDANFQANNAKIAIAVGGLLPNGPGTGTSRNYMPHSESDMIYALIIEEYGSLFGGLGLLLLYLILMLRAVRIAARCEKPFGSYAAIALALSLVLTAMMNMAVSVGMVPVTGQPLPLVSMGGTSIWFACLAVGIIISVSRSVYDKVPDAPEAKGRTSSTDEADVALA